MTLYAGLDLAKRSDFSAVVILDASRRQIKAALRLPHADFRDQINSIMPMLRQAKAVAVDRGGVGDAVIEFIPATFRVFPVLITGADKITDRGNVVAAGKRPLIELLLKSGVSVAEDAPGREDLKAEMMAFALKAGARGRFKMEARAGAHDDLVIAAGLSLLAASLDARKGSR
jgi:hypothetical protein